MRKPHVMDESDADRIILAHLAEEAKRSKQLPEEYSCLVTEPVSDELAALKQRYTRSAKEVANDRFELCRSARDLYHQVHQDVKSAPRDDKHILGRAMLECTLRIQQNAVAVKRRISTRGPALSDIDIDLDVLRDYYYDAYLTAPSWIGQRELNDAYEVINQVGTLVGGLMKASIAVR